MTISPDMVVLRERFAGLLLGTAVGDALGLPAENLAPEKIRKRWPGGWKMRFIFGRGMISDDTEHTLMVAQTLLARPANVDVFQRALARRFRWWFAGLPGGVGLATARACLKLWLGFPAEKAAVVSAGSGPAMRSAIIGACFASDPNRRKSFALASARLTHRSWQAETAALAVAEAAALAIKNPRSEAEQIFAVLTPLSTEPSWQNILLAMKRSLALGHSVAEFARSLGLQRGVTGYSLHVVPVAIYAWLRHPDDFRAALVAALDCGGDTDTVGAIVGALSGATVSRAGIPYEWIGNLCEWPRSVSHMEEIAARLAGQEREGHGGVGPVGYFFPATVFRNIIFLGIVLVHGLRRLF